MKLNRFDKKQLHELKNGGYEDASVYIILVDLCQDVGISEVFMMLHNVASDMKKKEELENLFDEAKKWTWPKYK